MEKYGFVYIWYDRKRKMYYIGSHWGGTIDDGYICSSNRMRDAYRRRPEDFKRRILEENLGQRIDLLLIEDKWLKLASKKKQNYYNLSFATPKTTYSRKGVKCSEEFKNEKRRLLTEQWKNSEYRKLMISMLKTRKFSEETRAKMSESKKGYVHPPEILKKISDSKRGKKRSAEVCAKISAGRLGKKYGPRGPYKKKQILN